LDNRPAESEFTLLFEKFYTKRLKTDRQPTNAYHSMKAHHQSLKMHYPPIIMSTQDKSVPSKMPSLIAYPLPCDVHLMILRTSTSPTNFNRTPNLPLMSPLKSAALVLQKLGVESSLEAPRFCLDSPQKVCTHFSFFTGCLDQTG
jgi:hypothetical protein